MGYDTDPLIYIYIGLSRVCATGQLDFEDKTLMGEIADKGYFKKQDGDNPFPAVVMI